MKYYTEDIRPEKRLKGPFEPSKVDHAAFVPMARQVEELMRAGVNLKMHRVESYDWPDEKSVDEYWEDLARRPGFDVADASMILQRIKERQAEKWATANTLKAGTSPSPASSETPEGSPAPDGRGGK